MWCFLLAVFVNVCERGCGRWTWVEKWVMLNSCGRTHTYTLHLCLELEMLRQKHFLATRCTLTTRCWCVRDHTHACLHRYDSAFMQKVVVMATTAPVIPLPSLFILPFPPTLLFPVLHSCLSLFVSSFLLFCFLYRILSMWFLFFFLFSQGTPEYIFF